MSPAGGAAEAWFGGMLPDAQAELMSGLISGISDLALLLRSDGRILELRAKPTLNPGVDMSLWVGKPMRDYLNRESLVKFDRCLATLRQGSAAVPLTELNHRLGSDGHEMPVSYSFHRIGADGEILMLGRDLRPMAEMQQQLVSIQISLERDYEKQRDTETRLRVLMAAQPEACLFVNVARREVTEANAAAASLFGRRQDVLAGSPLHALLHREGDEDLTDRLIDVAAAGEGKVTAQLAASGMDVDVFPSSFRTSGTHMLLCRVERRRAGREVGGPMEDRLAGLFANSPDAMIFTAADGAILSANGSFLDLADIGQEQDVRGRPLAEFLNRGGVDASILLENAERSGVLRLFATKIIGAHGGARPVEISITRLRAGSETIFALVMRDASRVDAVRAKPPSGSVDMGSVIDLIGKQSLKDIVARTTDVIEKMCIEAAVELTSNNRVAAADMLGLSRQSLYVKLRKYDILKRDEG
ncbi:transcriptional regulator PpsR [Jannaschia pohangensis]|nr:transcriptional regulator PpsR [Jannaschia pohangensis]